ncbi:MAG: outer membrane beta-barrel protein [Pseudomonadota bacterium]|nr:outer membrane beta-barrel protein [Pseudomonadota bacterium]
MMPFSVYTKLISLAVLLLTCSLANSEPYPTTKNSLLSRLSVIPHIGISQADIETDSAINASNQPEFDSNLNYGLALEYSALSWLKLEVDYTRHRESETNKQRDIAGEYKNSLTSDIVALGLQVETFQYNRTRLYVKGGGLIYNTQLTVKEYFDDVYPSGEASASDRGQGYYAGISLYHPLDDDIKFMLSINHQRLNDVFSDTRRAFDIRYNSLMLGLAF